MILLRKRVKCAFRLYEDVAGWMTAVETFSNGCDSECHCELANFSEFFDCFTFTNVQRQSSTPFGLCGLLWGCQLNFWWVSLISRLIDTKVCSLMLDWLWKPPKVQSSTPHEVAERQSLETCWNRFNLNFSVLGTSKSFLILNLLVVRIFRFSFRPRKTVFPAHVASLSLYQCCARKSF